MKHSYLSIEMVTVGDKLSYKKLWWTPTDAQKHLLFYTKECLFEKYSMYSDWNIMNFYIQKPKPQFEVTGVTMVAINFLC